MLAIYPGNATVFGTNYVEDAFAQIVGCDDDGGDSAGASKITAALAPGEYYAVVKGRNSAWGAADLPFNLSIRDDSATRAITCAGASGAGTPRITQTLPAGDYAVVLSDTQNAGSAGSGGAYSITFTDLSTSGQETGMQIGCALGTLDGGDANGDGRIDGVPVEAGEDYYVVVKGNTPTDSGNYALTVEDVFSSQAAAGSTPVACALEGTSVDAVYPAGDYYALVTGTGAQNGGYELNLRDVDPFSDYNRIACAGPDGGDAGSGTVAESGPNGTSVIEADLETGTHYVVVKGDGPGQTGTYKLNIRDVDARPDRQLTCANGDSEERLEYNVVAGRDYTVLLKGDGAGEQGAYNIKFYDELGLQSSGGQRLQCQTICPNTPTYQGGAQACTGAERMSNGFTRDLGADTYYLTVKGRRATEKGFYELQIGDPAKGSNVTRYVPPTWTEIQDALHPSDKPNAKDPAGHLVQRDQPERPVHRDHDPGAQPRRRERRQRSHQRPGPGEDDQSERHRRRRPAWRSRGARPRELPGDGHHAVGREQPRLHDRHPEVHRPGRPGAGGVRRAFTTGCLDTTAVPRNTINELRAGRDAQVRRCSSPTRSSPTTSSRTRAIRTAAITSSCRSSATASTCSTRSRSTSSRPTRWARCRRRRTPAPTRARAATSKQVFGAGCNYYQLEGEAAGADTCADGSDNNGNVMMANGGQDKGRDANHDGDFTDPMEFAADPGCRAGSCLDGLDNDGDGKLDINDPDCNTNDRQNWTDLYFKADIPAGTSVDFDMCTANSQAALATDCCTGTPSPTCTTSNFSRIATVSSVSGSCATNAECQDVNVGGTVKDGFCGTGGQCQFIDSAEDRGLLQHHGRLPERHAQRRGRQLDLQHVDPRVPLHDPAGRDHPSPEPGPERPAVREDEGDAAREWRRQRDADALRLVPHLRVRRGAVGARTGAGTGPAPRRPAGGRHDACGDRPLGSFGPWNPVPPCARGGLALTSLRSGAPVRPSPPGRMNMGNPLFSWHARTGLVVVGVLGAAAAGLGLLPAPAQACGGFFCSQAAPVEQAAEEIIFIDNPDDTVTAVIRIQYQGPSEQFAWVLPIAGAPEDVAVSSNIAFDNLRRATDPQYFLNTTVEGQCRDGGFGFPMGGASAPGRPRRPPPPTAIPASAWSRRDRSAPTTGT